MCNFNVIYIRDHSRDIYPRKYKISEILFKKIYMTLVLLIGCYLVDGGT